MTPDPALKTRDACAIAPGRAARWAELAGNAAEANSFYTPDMLIPALTHLVGDDAVRVIEAYSGSVLIGLMPVSMTGSHGRLPVANLTNWMHRHCFFGAPLIRRGAEQAAWKSFLEQVDETNRSAQFLHISGIDAAGANAAALEAVCVEQRRNFAEIQRYDRALLRSTTDADSYWDTHVRAKKRKEIRRLQKRLADLGAIKSRIMSEASDLPDWATDFLALEASGWKGIAGTALQCRAADTAFFMEALSAAQENGRLHFLRIDLDGKAIAMLVNFRHLDGAFSLKIAFDETLGRFSPGVLIEIDNLHAVLGDPSVTWMDSCAAADHPMIDSIWAERRSIAQFRIALKGSGLIRTRRAAAFAIAGAAERAAAYVKGR